MADSGLMKNVLRALLSLLFALFRSRLTLQVEILALRHHADSRIMPSCFILLLYLNASRVCLADLDTA